MLEEASTTERVFLWGAPGAGKTVVLGLAGGRWARQGEATVVLNLTHGARGLPLGHLLHKQVSQERILVFFKVQLQQ